DPIARLYQGNCFTCQSLGLRALPTLRKDLRLHRTRTDNRHQVIRGRETCALLRERVGLVEPSLLVEDVGEERGARREHPLLSHRGEPFVSLAHASFGVGGASGGAVE